MNMDRLTEARGAFEEAKSQNLQAGQVEHQRYTLAFLEDDKETMEKLVAAMSSEGFEWQRSPSKRVPQHTSDASRQQER